MSKQLEPEFIEFQRQLRDRIRKLRAERKWTLEQAEEEGSISWRHLQRIESGSNFTIYTLWRICQLFKIRPIELFRNNHKK